MAVAGDLGIEHEVVLYINSPPDEPTLTHLVKVLEDPVEDLVRKDAKFRKLGLNPDDFVDHPEAVVEILLKHKQLMQRPVLVMEDQAIIGRPKSRIIEFLGKFQKKSKFTE